jgi:hypothetical protein
MHKFNKRESVYDIKSQHIHLYTRISRVLARAPNYFVYKKFIEFNVYQCFFILTKPNAFRTMSRQIVHPWTW